MKILHLVGGELSCGAARGAYWLHLGLKSLGVDSTILTNSTTTFSDESIITTSKTKKDKFCSLIRIELDGLPATFYRKRRRHIFSSGLIGFDFTKTKVFKEAEILHLHWINGGFVNVKHLWKIDRPIVWTMRDMWPMTGGCHYAMECNRYMLGCGQCPQLGSRRSWDLSRFIAQYKKHFIPRETTVVGISNWLADCARASWVFEGCAVHVISNNIDTRTFFPVDQQQARQALGLDAKKIVVLVGAQNVMDFYKGFDLLVDALNSIDRHDVQLCSFGRTSPDCQEKLGSDHTSLGFLNDNISLRLAYSAADVFVAPSRMDAFGKTIAEAMACGTPVVCFDATGPKDIVDHKINGYLAKPYSSEDLANGIKWIINSANRKELRKNAKKKVVDTFDSKVVAETYIELYKKVLEI